MLTKVTIEPETVEVFYRNESLGFFNQYEFNDLRIRIMKQHSGEPVGDSDYYILKGNTKHIINTHGRVDGNWAFFTLLEDQLRELIRCG